MHHSDRGSQYASGDYTDLLKAHGCEISMSHKASPWENAGCESWMKTLKYEEVYRQEYRDLAEARASLGALHRQGLQPEATALGAGLPAAGGVRTSPAGGVPWRLDHDAGTQRAPGEGNAARATVRRR